VPILALSVRRVRTGRLPVASSPLPGGAAAPPYLATIAGWQWGGGCDKQIRLSPMDLG